MDHLVVDLWVVKMVVWKVERRVVEMAVLTVVLKEHHLGFWTVVE